MENENDLKKIMHSHKEQIKDMGLPIFLGYDGSKLQKKMKAIPVG